jgi:large subunit ribosomal protein L10
MGKMLRERIVAELADRYREMENCVFIDFTGLSVEAVGELRQQTQQKGAEFFVVRNSLLKLAFDKVGLPARDELFVRPTAVIAGGADPVAVCKLIVDWRKKTNTTEIKGGLLDRQLLTSEQVVELSKVPSRPVLLSEILGLFMSPLQGFANVLNNTLAQFANLVQNHVEKLEEQG